MEINLFDSFILSPYQFMSPTPTPFLNFLTTGQVQLLWHLDDECVSKGYHHEWCIITAETISIRFQFNEIDYISSVPRDRLSTFFGSSMAAAATTRASFFFPFPFFPLSFWSLLTSKAPTWELSFSFPIPPLCLALTLATTKL